MNKLSLLILLLIFATIIACKTPTKVMDSARTESHDNSRLDVEASHLALEVTSSTVTVSQDEQTITEEVTTTITYDTSKPVDPSTGKPPVQSESTSKKTTATGKSLLAEGGTTTNTGVEDRFHDRSELDRGDVVQVSHSETPKYNTLKYISTIAVVLLIGTILYILNRKFKWLPLPF